MRLNRHLVSPFIESCKSYSNRLYFQPKVCVKGVNLKSRYSQIIESYYRYILTALVFGVFSAYFVVYLLFARPRGFKGDFYAAMYDPNWWDGEGLFYGPLFVFERWFVNSFPEIATVNFFAFQVFLILAVTLLITLRIVRADKVFSIFGLSVWTANSYFYYSFSVAANPEILELIFIVWMWWALSRKYIKTAYAFFSLAVITKVVPIIFSPVLLLVFNPQAFIVGFLIIVISILIVSFGQQEDIISILRDLIPVSIVDPQPNSEQFLGLSNALSRVFGISPGGDFKIVTNLAIGLTIILYILVTYIAISVFRTISKSNYEISIAYIFSAFMSLMPLMHFTNTHRHTYLFLGPVWIALRYVYINNVNLKNSLIFSRVFTTLFILYTFLPIYFLDISPLSKLSGIHLGETNLSFLMLSEPIWTNLAIIVTIIIYGFSLVRTNRNTNIPALP